MTSFNKLFKGVSQQFNQNSVGWGSLLVWVSALTIIIMMMARFSQIY